MRRLLAFASISLLAFACAEPPPPEVPPPPPAPPALPPPAPPAPPPPAETPDADFRKQAPDPGPEVRFVPPVIQEAKLANGIRVLLVERHELPIISLRVVANEGADQASPGVGSFAGAMWMAGTKKRSALTLSDAFRGLGADYGAFVGYDESQAYIQVLATKFPDALDLLADVVQHPAFPKDELKRERSRRLNSILQEHDSPQRLLGIAVGEALYPRRHPYHASLLGTEEAVGKISSADLELFYNQYIKPDRVTITAAGDITKASLVEQLEKAFGTWKGKSEKAKTPADPPAPAADAAKIVLLDRPDASQSNVSVSMVGVPRSSKDFDAIMVMNTILGGPFMSRINMNLREKHAYTYGARSGFAMRHGAGPFSIGGAIVRESTAPAVKEILAEIDSIRTAPVSAEELEGAKGYLIKQLPSLFETAGETSGALANLAVYGLPLDEYATRAERINRVTEGDVKRVAGLYLKPDQLRVVLVGDAAKIQDSLTGLGIGKVEVKKVAPADKKGDKKGDKKAKDAGDAPRAPKKDKGAGDAPKPPKQDKK